MYFYIDLGLKNSMNRFTLILDNESISNVNYIQDRIKDQNPSDHAHDPDTLIIGNM